MKRFTLTTIITLITVGLFIAACSSEQKPTTGKTTPERATPEDIKKEAKDLARVSKAYTDQHIAEYKRNLSEKMALFNYQQRQIKEKLGAMNEQAQASIALELEELKTKRAALDKKIVEIYSASSETFDELKEGADNALNDMENAYNQTLENIQE